MPSISWTKRGRRISSSGDSRISFGSDNKFLNMTSVNKTDSGEYRCVAINILGNTSSNTATVDVQCKNYMLYSNILFMCYQNNYRGRER